MVLLVLLATSGCNRKGITSLPGQSVAIVTAKPGIFEDVTDRAGIRFHHSNGDKANYQFIETCGGGCAFLDYDGDGYIDILLLSSGHFGKPSVILALYHNNRNGTFTDVTSGSGLDIPMEYGQGVAIGDYDNDGYPDIFVAGYGGCRLFHNTGKLAKGHLFEDVTITAGVGDKENGPRWASGAAWGDFDNDGKLDLVIIHYAKWSPETDKKCPRQDGSPGYCVPSVYSGDSMTLYHNEGNGKFKNVSVSSGLNNFTGRSLAISWLDYNHDGKPDLYVANDLDPNYLLRNNGNGTFTEVGAEVGVATGTDGQAMSGMGIALGDYDHSGRESIFVPNLNGEGFSLFHNEGKGLFSFASLQSGLMNATLTHSGWGAAFVDFDRDGWLDIASANGNVHPQVAQDMPGITYEEPKGLYRNLGNGRFQDITQEGGGAAIPRAGRGLAIGDFDNDGKMDLLAVNRNQRADLLHNISKDKHHWINILLVGHKSNRDGAGAIVTVDSGGVHQTQVCRLGSSYASSSDKRLFFGLGDSNSFATVTVNWPSGIVTTIKQSGMDRIITIDELTK